MDSFLSLFPAWLLLLMTWAGIITVGAFVLVALGDFVIGLLGKLLLLCSRDNGNNGNGDGNGNGNNGDNGNGDGNNGNGNGDNGNNSFCEKLCKKLKKFWEKLKDLWERVREFLEKVSIYPRPK